MNDKHEHPERVSIEGAASSGLATAAAGEDELDLPVRVLDSSEHPVGGARLDAYELPLVTTYMFDASDRPHEVHVADGVSNDRGEFAFFLPVGRQYKVDVAADGYVPVADGFLQPGRDVSVHVFREATVRGHVVSKSDQVPIVGAHVLFTDGEDPWKHLDVRTDGAGAFVITGLSAGKYSYLSVEARHWGVVERVDLDIHEGQTITHDVELVAGHSVSGIVRDATSKQGISGAVVYTDDSQVDWPDRKTDSNGRFFLDGIATDALVYVRVRAHGYPRAEQLVRMDHGSVDGVVFDLAQPRKWHGRIVLPDGSPAADTWVYAKGSALHESDDTQGVRTGSDGTFELTRLRADVHHVLVARKEHCGATSVHLPDLDRDASKPEVALGDIVLLPSALLSGDVVDEDGAPIPDVQVHLQNRGVDRFALVKVDPDADYNAQDWRGTTTDSRGRFAFADLAAGTCILQFEKSGLASRADPQLELAAGELRRGFRVVLPTKIAIAGRVVDAKGSPCADASVRIEREPDGKGECWGKADSQGRFRIAGLTPGRYWVTASPEYDNDGSFRTVSGSVRGVDTGTRDVLVVIPPFTWIEGVVVDPNGVPAPHALVYGYDSRGVALGSTSADEHGHFRYKVAVDSATDLTAGWTQLKENAFDVYEAIDDESSRIREVGVPAGKRDLILKLGPHP
jgi:protocatechuate 3,4-dioxygenase beta subunit